MRTAVVIPVGPGRTENLMQAVAALAAQTRLPDALVVVHDGPEAHEGDITGMPLPTFGIVLKKKHEPGMEQPRNEGVRVVRRHFPDVDHVWFLDSDVVVEPTCYEAFVDAHHAAPKLLGVDETSGTRRILIGPYEWLQPGLRPEGFDPLDFFMTARLTRSDFRWDLFTEHDASVIFERRLNVALACFSGNLVWPVEEFVRVGGYWSEIHHGRCEDGELGLRAASLGVPMSVVRDARGYHLWHPINTAWCHQANARDVPMLNRRHPWVEDQGLIVSDEDGARFDIVCGTCGEQVNTILMWEHESKHRTEA